MGGNVEQREVIILGGGPAGLSTALHLAALCPDLVSAEAAPARILVLEKAHYPRRKLCAGGLVEDAEILLRRLGLDVSEIPHVDADAARFDFAGRGLTVRRRGTHALRIIRRDEFDAWLAEKTRSRGVEVRDGVRVKDVQVHPEGVIVETEAGTFSAKLVVGADGSNGLTRRAVLPEAPVNTARLLEVISPACPPSNESGAGREAAYFDFFPVPQGIAGYVWDFPTQLGGQPMRCWGIYDTNLLADLPGPPFKDPLRQAMARQGLALEDYRVEGHPIRWFSPFNRFSAPRVLLAGDAAGADPLFGEGISMALGYGKVAAEEAERALSQGDFHLAGYRRRLLASPLGQTLIARWLLAYLVYSWHWSWSQFVFWRVLKPVVLLLAHVFVLNWARRMK